MTSPLPRNWRSRDPGNAGWQRDLAVSYSKIGDAMVAQGNLPEALKTFRDGLAIATQLAKSDPSSASWQRDLSVSYNKTGDVLAAQGNLPEALKSFRDGHAIRNRLALSDPTNAGWQADLVVSHWKLAANGDDAPRRWAFIVATLHKLRAENRLTLGAGAVAAQGRGRTRQNRRRAGAMTWR